MGTTETPVGRYRIAEVSRLTGFTPTTLRFYENAGVVAPPGRTAAGYRVYDDRDVERLRLVARAKELGCTLDDIAGLVEAWDADECGPVKHRLRSLVNAKVADIRRHISDQVALAAQLQATAANLAGRPVDGPCDDRCGCTATTTEPVVPSNRASGRGSSESAVPIACSLGGGDMAARIDEWHSVLAAVDERQAISGGVRLVLGPGARLADIARLAAAEHDCCRFFAFAVTIDDRGIALEVTAPDDGQDLLGAVFGVAASPVPR